MQYRMEHQQSELHNGGVLIAVKASLNPIFIRQQKPFADKGLDALFVHLPTKSVHIGGAYVNCSGKEIKEKAYKELARICRKSKG